MSLRTDRSALVFEEGIPPVVPKRDGPDISWLSRCRVGDNQGSVGACVIFALASWTEIMTGNKISDTECLDVYGTACERFDIPYGRGMSFKQGFEVASEAGWMADGKKLKRVADLDELGTQPLLAGYKVTGAWEPKNMRNGCLDHSSALKYVEGYHAVVIVAHGALLSDMASQMVYIENSWGRGWGWEGCGVMDEDLHARLCREIWRVLW